MGEIFPPYKCTHGPGEDPFEAVMCAVGAASQISCCLSRILFLIQNTTCNLHRILFTKIIEKRYHCVQIYKQFLKAVFNFQGKTILTYEIVYVTSLQAIPRMGLSTGGR